MTTRGAFHIKLRQLGYDSYDAYLASTHWSQTKQEFRTSDQPQDCYCCKSSENIHLHHKTYERLGAELLTDLVALCARCHTMIHILERRGDLNINLIGLLNAERAKQNCQTRLRQIESAKSEEIVARIRQAVASRNTAEILTSSEDLNRLAGYMQQQDHRASVPPTGKSLEDRVRDLQSRALKGDQQAQRHIFMIRKHLTAAESRRARGIAA